MKSFPDGDVLGINFDDIKTPIDTKVYLEKQGYRVSHFDNAVDAQRALDNLAFQLAIFDVMMPGGDGFSLLKNATKKDIPSIMVTAKVTESDRIHGFDLGADDYVCKPYSPREVVSRVQALLKRSYKHTGAHQIWLFGQLEIDVDAKLVKLAGDHLKLTAVESEPDTAQAEAEPVTFLCCVARRWG